MSAARMQPIATAKPAGDVKERLKSGAENVVLNAVGALGDWIKDFSRTTKYFKYKVMIVAAFLVLSTGSVWVACPTNPLAPSNDLGATLVIAGDASRPVYMVKNESDETWTNVMLVVNHQYRAVSAKIDAGGNFTLTPKQLVGENGKLAPPDMKVVHLELRTDDGDEVLLENGQVR